MKKIIASIGLLALGAFNSQAQYAPGLSPQETTKPWSLSASLRGFYDDNYLTLPNTIPNPNYLVAGAAHALDVYIPGKIPSWGVEVSPSVSYNHAIEQTLFSASYVYDMRWYENHSTMDQSHQLNLKVDHAFSERYKLQANDSFVVAQEPTILDSSVISSPLRTAGSNVRNTGSLDGTAQLSRLFDLHAGYANTMYAYQQTEGDVVVYGPRTAVPMPPAPIGTGAFIAPQLRTPSRSALLDRMEQVATLDLRWKVQPATTGIFGYQYEHVDFTSPEGINFTGSGPSSAVAFSKIRNNDQHFGFVGADHSFTTVLNGSIRAGAEYVDYYNYHTEQVSPYVDASLTYQYMQASYAQVGVKNIHNTSDVVGFGANGSYSDVTLDTDTTAVYMSLTQQIASRVTGSLMGQFQDSRFNGGTYGGLSDDFFIVGLNFAYHINPFLLVEAGYNWNKLDSDIPFRGYTRNQIYVGVRGTY